MSMMASQITNLTIQAQIKQNIKTPRHWHQRIADTNNGRYIYTRI